MPLANKVKWAEAQLELQKKCRKQTLKASIENGKTKRKCNKTPIVAQHDPTTTTTNANHGILDVIIQHEGRDYIGEAHKD